MYVQSQYLRRPWGVASTFGSSRPRVWPRLAQVSGRQGLPRIANASWLKCRWCPRRVSWAPQVAHVIYIRACVSALRPNLGQRVHRPPQGMFPGGAYYCALFSKSEACRGATERWFALGLIFQSEACRGVRQKRSALGLIFLAKHLLKAEGHYITGGPLKHYGVGGTRRQK